MADFNFFLNRQGIQGKKGEKGDQGFSPVISEGQNTSDTYTLQITNEFDTYETPNLRGQFSIEDRGGKYVLYDSENNTLSASDPIPATSEIEGVVSRAVEEDFLNIQETAAKFVNPYGLVNAMPAILDSPDDSVIIRQNPETMRTELLVDGSGTQESIAQERAERIAQDNILNQDITAANRNINAVSERLNDVNLRLDLEEHIRLAADTQQQQQIDAERQERETQDASLQTQLGSKLTADNIKAGSNVTITRDGNNVTINSTGGGGGGSTYLAGDGIDITADVISARVDNQTIKIQDGVMHADLSEIGDELNSLSGRVNALEGEVVIATDDRIGMVKPDGSTITINTDGVISAVGGGEGKLYQAGTGLDLTGDNTDTFDLMTEDKYEETGVPRWTKYGSDEVVIASDNTLESGAILVDWSDNDNDKERSITIPFSVTELKTYTSQEYINIISSGNRSTDFIRKQTYAGDYDIALLLYGVYERRFASYAGYGDLPYTLETNKTYKLKITKPANSISCSTTLYISDNDSIYLGGLNKTLETLQSIIIFANDTVKIHLDQIEKTSENPENNWTSVLGGRVLVKPAAKATTEKLGLVKVDGSTITVDEDGTIHGSSSVEVDNTTIEVNSDGKLQTTVDINALQSRVEDLQLYKFPNATIIGEPTINNGQISNFTANNYLQFPFEFETKGRTWELNGSFHVGMDSWSQQNIIDSRASIALAVRNSRLVLALSTNGETFNLGEHESSGYFLYNETYYFRIVFDGNSYTLSTSTDKIDYTTEAVVNSSTPIASRPITISSPTNPFFSGSINLNDWNLTIVNNLVWQGMDDVGIASRMDVNSSNITKAGIDHLKEVLGLANIETILNEILGNEEAIGRLVDDING